MKKYIHLLYVPTMNCNMQCKYCYLGDNTIEQNLEKNVLQTLKYAVDKFGESNVVPYNISLHGGEVTTLGKQEFQSLVEYIDLYYKEKQFKRRRTKIYV